MTIQERKELLDILVKDYLHARKNNSVWQREESSTCSYSRGRLTGACLALNLEIDESDDFLTIHTNRRKRVVTQIEKSTI
jgi:hypothetical protein